MYRCAKCLLIAGLGACEAFLPSAPSSARFVKRRQPVKLSKKSINLSADFFDGGSALRSTPASLDSALMVVAAQDEEEAAVSSQATTRRPTNTTKMAVAAVAVATLTAVSPVLVVAAAASTLASTSSRALASRKNKDTVEVSEVIEATESSLEPPSLQGLEQALTSGETTSLPSKSADHKNDVVIYGQKEKASGQVGVSSSITSKPELPSSTTSVVVAAVAVGIFTVLSPIVVAAFAASAFAAPPGRKRDTAKGETAPAQEFSSTVPVKSPSLQGSGQAEISSEAHALYEEQVDRGDTWMVDAREVAVGHMSIPSSTAVSFEKSLPTDTTKLAVAAVAALTVSSPVYAVAAAASAIALGTSKTPVSKETDETGGIEVGAASASAPVESPSLQGSERRESATTVLGAVPVIDTDAAPLQPPASAPPDSSSLQGSGVTTVEALSAAHKQAVGKRRAYYGFFVTAAIMAVLAQAQAVSPVFAAVAAASAFAFDTLRLLGAKKNKRRGYFGFFITSAIAAILARAQAMSPVFAMVAAASAFAFDTSRLLAAKKKGAVSDIDTAAALGQASASKPAESYYGPGYKPPSSRMNLPPPAPTLAPNVAAYGLSSAAVKAKSTSVESSSSKGPGMASTAVPKQRETQANYYTGYKPPTREMKLPIVAAGGITRTVVEATSTPIELPCSQGPSTEVRSTVPNTRGTGANYGFGYEPPRRGTVPNQRKKRETYDFRYEAPQVAAGVSAGYIIENTEAGSLIPKAEVRSEKESRDTVAGVKDEEERLTAKAEEKRLAAGAITKADKKRQAIEAAAAKVENEWLAAKADLKAEEGRLAAVAAAKAEKEKFAAEAAANAEEERLPAVAAAKAETEKFSAVAAAKAEEERLTAEEKAAAAAREAAEERLAAVAAVKAESKRLVVKAASNAEEERPAAVAAAKAKLKRLVAEAAAKAEEKKFTVEAVSVVVEEIVAAVAAAKAEEEMLAVEAATKADEEKLPDFDGSSFADLIEKRSTKGNRVISERAKSSEPCAEQKQTDESDELVADASKVYHRGVFRHVYAELRKLDQLKEAKEGPALAAARCEQGPTAEVYRKLTEKEAASWAAAALDGHDSDSVALVTAEGEGLEKVEEKQVAEADAKAKGKRLPVEAAAKAEVEKLSAETAADSAAKAKGEKLAAEAAAKFKGKRLVVDTAAKSEKLKLYTKNAAAKAEKYKLLAEAAAKVEEDGLAVKRAAANTEKERLAAEGATKAVEGESHRDCRLPVLELPPELQAANPRAGRITAWVAALPDATVLTYAQPNPKKKGSAAHKRYAVYSQFCTLGERRAFVTAAAVASDWQKHPLKRTWDSDLNFDLMQGEVEFSLPPSSLSATG